MRHPASSRRRCSLLWVCSAASDELGDRDFTIGSDSDGELPIGTPLPAGSCPRSFDGLGLRTALRTADERQSAEDDRTIRFTKRCRRSGEASAAVAGAYAMPIGTDARISVQLGENTFHCRQCHAPNGCLFPLDRLGNGRIPGGVFAVTGLFLALIFSIPPDPRSLSYRCSMNDQRYMPSSDQTARAKGKVIPSVAEAEARRGHGRQKASVTKRRRRANGAEKTRSKSRVCTP